VINLQATSALVWHPSH